MKSITRDELKSRLDRGDPVILLEALPENYYRDGHLPGARLFPHDQARVLATSVVPDKNAPVVVYCASATCKNSHEAAEVLAAIGYEDVRVYVEGKADWKAAGLPLEH